MSIRQLSKREAGRILEEINEDIELLKLFVEETPRGRQRNLYKGRLAARIAAVEALTNYLNNK